MRNGAATCDSLLAVQPDHDSINPEMRISAASGGGMLAIRFKKRNAIIGGAIYLYIAFMIVGLAFLSGIGAILALAYIGGCMYAIHAMIEGAHAKENSSTFEFKRYYGLDAFGVEWSSFFHVFKSKDLVSEAAISRIGASLNSDLVKHSLKKIDVVDKDSDLSQPELRSFFCTDGIKTSRGAVVTFVMYSSRVGDVQGLRWWIMARGVYDPNKKFWSILYSPITLPFLIVPYITGKLKPLNWIRSTDLGFYNGLDMLSFSRKMQFVAFYALVDTLESYGLDVSDLKSQVESVLNINVSGGSANFGNVVQGAFNKIGGGVGKGKGHE